MTYAFNPFTGNLDYTESTKTIAPLEPGSIDNMAIGLNTPREGRFTALGADSLQLSEDGFETLLNSLGVQTSIRIYVDSDAPASNDVASNRGRDGFRPFRTLERAFVEAARISKTVGGSDFFSRIAIVVQPGRYYVDNRPGKSEASILPLPAQIPLHYEAYQEAFRLLELNTAVLLEIMFAAVDSLITWSSDPTEEALEKLRWKNELSKLLTSLIKDVRILSNESTLALSRSYRHPDGSLAYFTEHELVPLVASLTQLQDQLPLVLGNDEATTPVGGNYATIPNLLPLPAPVISFVESLSSLFLSTFENPLTLNPWSIEIVRGVTPSLYEANPPRVILDSNQQPVSAASYGKARDASRLLHLNRSLLLNQVLTTTALPSTDHLELTEIVNTWIDAWTYDLAYLTNQKSTEQARLYLTLEGDPRVYSAVSPFRTALKAALNQLLTLGLDVISNSVPSPLTASELIIQSGDPCSNEKATFSTLVSIIESAFDTESLINPWDVNVVPPVTSLSGGIVVPKGVSFVSLDLRKTEIIPLYLGEYRSYQSSNSPEIDYLTWDYPHLYSWSSIFKVTGGTYSYGLTYRDIPFLDWTHHRVIATTFANDDLEFDKESGSYYYSKVKLLFSNVDPELDIGSSKPEVEIVSPLLQPEIDRVEGASPYLYNCSVRSSYGMNALWADGARVSGFKSIVSAQFTQVVLQRFKPAYQKWSDSKNAWVPLDGGEEYFQLAPAIYESYIPYIDPLNLKPLNNSIRYHPDWVNFGFRVSNESFSQLVSCFCIGTARGYVAESGGDFSITNSNTNFGETAMYAEGFRPSPTPPDAGFLLTHVVPPKPVTSESIVGFKISKLDGASLYSYWYNEGGTKQTDRLYVTNLISEASIRPFTFKPGTRLHLKLPRTNQPSLDLSVELVEVDGEVFVNEIGEFSTSSYFHINPINSLVLETGIQLGDGLSTQASEISQSLQDAECLIRRVVDRRPLLDRAYHLRLAASDGIDINTLRRPSFGFILNSSNNNLINPLTWVSDSRINLGPSETLESYDITLLGFEENGEPQPLTYSPYALETLDEEPVVNNNGLITFPDLNPPTSPTRKVVESLLTRLEAVYADSTVQAGQLSNSAFEIEPLAVTLQFHRPSIIRCSGHTFEYAGYLNYSQGIPEFQQINISPEQRLYKQRKNLKGGRCFYSGLDHEGLLWAGDKATNLSTGEVFELSIQETIPEIEIPARFTTITADTLAIAGEINIGNGAVTLSPLGMTGGTISGITDLAIADGGTGASDAAAARTNLGLGTLSTQDANSVSITGGTISGITDLAIADGGTGASDAAAARTNLGLGTLSTQDANSVSITGGTITGVPVNLQVSNSFPVSSSSGNLVYNSSTGRLYIYYEDIDSGQWVDAAPTSAGVTDIKIIDNLAPQFNHSTTIFNLLSSGQAVFPVSAQQLLISLDKKVLNPGVDYTVQGSQITFTAAPTSNDSFFGVIYGTSTVLNTVSDNSITTAKLQNSSVTPSKLNLNANILPAQDNTYNLGSEALRFANLYTGDLHLKNERGDWTVIEEAQYLSLRNNKTGKLYQLQMVEINGEDD